MQKVLEALKKFQMECPTVNPDAVNTHFKQKYATRGQILKTILPILNKHGLVLVQTPKFVVLGDDIKANIETFLYHESGEQMTLGQVPYEHSGTGQNADQTKGKSMTYALRFALNALGIVTDEDDDGRTQSTKVSSASAKTTDMTDDRARCIKSLEDQGIKMTKEITDSIVNAKTKESLKAIYSKVVSSESSK